MYEDISYPLVKQAIANLLKNFTHSKLNLGNSTFNENADIYFRYTQIVTIVITGITLIIMAIIKYKNNRQEKVPITPWKFHQIVEYPFIFFTSLALVAWVLTELIIMINKLNFNSILFTFLSFVLSLLVVMLIVYPISSSIITEKTSVKILGFIYCTMLLGYIANKFYFFGLNVGYSYFISVWNLVITVDAVLMLTLICTYNALKLLSDKGEHELGLTYLNRLYGRLLFKKEVKQCNNLKQILKVPATLYCSIYLGLGIVFTLFGYFIMLLTDYMYDYLINYNHENLLNDADLVLTTVIKLDNNGLSKMENIFGFISMVVYYEIIICGVLVIFYQFIQMNKLLNCFEKDILRLQHSTSNLLKILNNQSTDPMSNSIFYPSYQIGFIIIGSFIQFCSLLLLIVPITLYGIHHYLTISKYEFDYKAILIPITIIIIYLGVHLFQKIVLKRPIFSKPNQERFAAKNYSYRRLYFSEIFSFILLLLMGFVGIFRNIVIFIVGIIYHIKDFSRTDLLHHLYPSFSICSIGYREYMSFLVIHFMHTNPLLLSAIKFMQEDGGRCVKRRWKKTILLATNPDLIKYSKNNENMLKFD